MQPEWLSAVLQVDVKWAIILGPVCILAKEYLEDSCQRILIATNKCMLSLVWHKSLLSFLPPFRNVIHKRVHFENCVRMVVFTEACFSLFGEIKIQKKVPIFTFSLFNPFSLVVFRLAWDSNTILYKPWFHDASCISGGQSSRIKKRQCHLTMERTRKWTEWSILSRPP